jgi:hypothetical protein
MKKITINNEATINARGKFNSNHCTPIMFLKLDGSEMHSFTSVADASEELGISASYISTCLNNEENPVCKGYIVFRTKDAPMYIGKIMHYFNSNASDATKYQRIKAEEEAARKAEELRLEEERKARERHAAAVAKAEAKVAKYAADCAKYQEKFNEAMTALDKASQELEALMEA